jgi:GR25 family glycosyltransferase involved in LPS biosynthesis
MKAGTINSKDLENHLENKIKKEFELNEDLKEYIITLLGYKNIKQNGSRHTNWFPWNRFYNVFQTIGYKVEWVEIDSLERKEEKRLFITWNEPTCLELYQSGKILTNDIVFQKLTSLGKGMEKENWTDNPRNWCDQWYWPIYRTVEYLFDKRLNIYAFGCLTDINLYSEKQRICKKLKNRIFWISWGGTPFDWKQIKNCQPKMNDLSEDITFVGSKWGVVGRGNVDAWGRYIEPFEFSKCPYKFKKYGGNDSKLISDKEMIETLQKSKICPIVHSPSWQAEKGVQDRFYSIFLSGRFGICDNLGAIDVFGDEIKEICTEDPKEYYKKSIYFLEHPEEQVKYINFIQSKIKTKYNFYRQWENILNNVTLNFDNSNNDIITNINYHFLPKVKTNYIPYKSESINEYFDKIFIINMKKDKDKKLQILEYLDYFNIKNFEFIEAIDGNDLDVQKYNHLLNNDHFQTIWERKNGKKHFNKISEIGCLLSHLKILNIAKTRGYKKWLHLEDDVVFQNDFNHKFQLFMSQVPMNWDLIFLGTTQAYWRESNIENINDYFYNANISCGTFSFAVSNTNLDFIINRFNEINAPADSTIVSEIQNILNCYVIKDNLIVARLNKSCVRESIDNISDENLYYRKYNWNMNDFFIDSSKHYIINDEIKNIYNITCNDYTDIKEFYNFLKNKKVAIIGPSPSVRKTKNGKFIENNYDVIVRVNKHWKHDPSLNEYIGERTDILYNCMDYRDDCGGNIDIDYIKDKIQFVVSSINYNFNNKKHRDSQFHGKSFLNWYYHFHKNNRNRVKFIPMSSSIYDDFDKKADTRINTGLMAIFHILNFDIKELYIKGFSFFLDGYLTDYRNVINNELCNSESESTKKVFDYLNASKNHDQEKQWKLFKEVYSTKKNIITLDDTLQEIVDLKMFPKSARLR